jgi:hypothetical protein
VIGIDIAQGVGSSNSVMSVLDIQTGWQVAEFADPMTTPVELARLAIMAGYWFGGHRGHAFIIWEANGPGVQFLEQFETLGYPWHYHQRQVGTKGRDETKREGFTTSGNTKEWMLGKLRGAMALGRYRTRSKEFIAECSKYTFSKAGEPVSGTMIDQRTGARARHGDRVIAAGLCVVGAEECPRIVSREEPTTPGTPAHRRRARTLADKQRARTGRW